MQQRITNILDIKNPFNLDPCQFGCLNIKEGNHSFLIHSTTEMCG
jgi:hypothetical protein